MKQRGGRMSYLGVIRGSGTLRLAGEDLGRADYDLDGFMTSPGEVVASGEIRMAAEALARAAGRNDVQLTTDEGRVLAVRFSPARNNSPDNAAHADVSGELPPAKEWRR